MFGDDEDIRSDRDLADDYRREIDRLDRLVSVMEDDLDRKHAEIVRLRECMEAARAVLKVVNHEKDLAK